MSLLERAQGVAQTMQSKEKGSLTELEMLRKQVHVFIPVDDLAMLLSKNVEQARSEIKSACRRSFEQAAWSNVSAFRREQLIKELLDEVLGFGPLESLLEDDSITEIMVNGPESIFFERNGLLYKSEQVFSSTEQLRTLIDRILGPLGRRIDEASPMVNARLPQGHRVHAIVPPLALDGPILTIRKFTRRVMTLENMEESNSFDARMRQFLTKAVQARKSIAVSGGTGAGKTTLLNALSCEISHKERIVTIEDSAELRFLEHPHVVRLEARPRNAEGKGEVTIRDLVINALRMRPDRIVVGECRSSEALDMLQSMITGHDGSLTSLHANAPTEVVARLITMVRYAADLPVDVIEAHIASAFDFVVQMARASDGSRFISEVATFSYDEERRRCRVESVFVRKAGEPFGTWKVDPLTLLDQVEPLLSEGGFSWKSREYSAA